MEYTVDVENIKCGGCANTIHKTLLAIPGVDTASVDVEAGRITASGVEGLDDALRAALLKAGYPEKGSAEGVKAAAAKARSFVSCAVGKFGSQDS